MVHRGRAGAATWAMGTKEGARDERRVGFVSEGVTELSSYSPETQAEGEAGEQMLRTCFSLSKAPKFSVHYFHVNPGLGS